MPLFRYNPLDFLFTVAGLPLFLFDVVLDVLAAVDLYREEAYLCLAVLLLLLIGSSVLTQLYSWLWYKDDDFNLRSCVESFLNPGLGVLHLFQLGIYVRHLAILETSMKICCSGHNLQDVAVYMNHDLGLLRIMETFSESAPQIVLMLAVILQRGKLDHITVLKTVGSVSAVAFCVTTYHRCMRSFQEDKKKQSFLSSVVYFLWNLLLLSSRIVALALFASVQPCFIFTHFFCSWLVLFFFAWRSKTAFMSDAAGEWLYRATVGLIWYFAWFSVVAGTTRRRSLLYHSYILLDLSVLCGVWFWKMSWDPPFYEISCLQAAVCWGVVVGVYVLGLVSKILYYQFFHPTLNEEELIGGGERQGDELDAAPAGGALSDSHLECAAFRTMPQPLLCNRRMKKLAENFYSRSADGGLNPAV